MSPAHVEEELLPEEVQQWVVQEAQSTSSECESGWSNNECQSKTIQLPDEQLAEAHAAQTKKGVLRV
jgi:hypothetical protein